jgi:hypothetical protein
LDIFNINTKKNIFSLFLVAILLSGTITTFFPTLSMKEVHTISSDGNYGLKMEEDDNDNNDSKYQSTNFPDKNESIECTNFNLNANGFNIDDIPESIRDLLNTADRTQTEELDVEGNDFDNISTSNNDENSFSSNHEDYVTICKNNNHNEQPTSTLIPPTPPTPPEEDDNVYVVWRDQTSQDNGEIFFTVSNDNGQTFSTPQNLSKNAGFSVNPQMLVSDSNVYVVWQDDSNGGDVDIFFNVSNDNGQTFLDTPIDLSNNAGFSFNLQMLVSGSNVYVVWQDDSNGSDVDIFFNISNNNGQTFLDTPIDLSNNDGSSFNPQMLVSGSNVYVVWQDDSNGGADIFFNVSNNNGQTFLDTPIDLSNNAGFSVTPQMLVSGSNVYVVWRDISNGGDFDMLFNVSNDNGQTFLDTPIDLSNNDGSSVTPQMLVSGSNVYVVWEDDSNGGDVDIFFNVSNNNGQTFLDTPIDLSKDDTNSFDAKIIVQ